MERAASLWDLLAAAGGSLALIFIVVLAVCIGLMTAMYLVSAVIVLERFARVVRRLRGVLLASTLLSIAAAAIFVRVEYPELAARSWGEWFEAFAPAVIGCAIATAISVAISWALLRLPMARVASVLGILLLSGIGLAFFAPTEGMAVAGSSLLSVLMALVVFGLLPLAVGGLIDMRRTVEWFIAVRYLIAKRRQIFISAITMICIGGIAAGVWLIVIVLSVMNGFEKTWRDEIVGNRAHFTVHSSFGAFSEYENILEAVRGVPGVTGASPYLDAEGMVRGRAGEIFGVRVRGIDPRSVTTVTDLSEDMIVGSLSELDPLPTAAEGGDGSSKGNGESSERRDGEDPGIVIGNQLARSLGVQQGEPLLLISPYGGPPTPLGPAPRLKRFRVVGVFESSFFQYDEVYTYVSLASAQDFRRAGDVIDGIEARTTDFYRSQRVADFVRFELDYPFFTRDWKEFFPAFFQALKTERVMMFVLLTMIMVVAAFIIVTTLIMMIMEKSSDIAILKAMGADDSTIERIFAIEGTLIGLAGTCIGVIAGIAVTKQLPWIQSRIEAITGIDTLPPSVYQFSTLPSEVDPVQVTLVAAIAMVLSLGATLLPSRQGARLDPAEALRYE